MDIGKVKVDQINLLACLPYTLSLVSNLEVKAPKICAELFGNVYFIQVIQIKWENIWNSDETVSSVGTGKQFYILLRLAITPYYPLATLAFTFIHCLLLSIVIYYIGY